MTEGNDAANAMNRLINCMRFWFVKNVKQLV